MPFLPNDVELRLREEIARRGLVLLDLVQRGQRNTTVLEVVVDAEQGVTLDAIADLSRWTSALLDEFEEELPGRYRLEVSSAGLSRPLEHAWQYRKNIGRLVKASYADSEGTIRSELFRLVEVEEEIITFERSGGPRKQERLSIPLERIRKAVIEPEF